MHTDATEICTHICIYFTISKQQADTYIFKSIFFLATDITSTYSYILVHGLLVDHNGRVAIIRRYDLSMNLIFSYVFKAQSFP